MDRFQLILSPKAVRDLDKFTDKIHSKIVSAMRVLEENPFPKGKLIRNIKGKALDYYRLRADKYRVFFMIEGNKVVVLGVMSKKDAERFIQSLN
ncbi:MAG: type II toxin-antitoxin system RelE/ParE family toxin [Proteobacteria bacterium]|nr:type II toxin-antitoxin system RelE/ParE family toxin [Pseudomonadota bacterium]